MKFIVITVLALVLIPVANASHLSSERLNRLSTKVLAKEAKKVVRNGGVYSHRCGDAKLYLRKLSHELVERGFAPYGSSTVQWALYIVDRESCFNPGAINYTWPGWDNQAKGLAQIIPKYHTWINYDRMLVDPWYAVKVFVKLSDGGKVVGPWILPS